MSELELLYWPDARLSQRCNPVGADQDVRPLVKQMFDLMYASQGRGLAAPQVGVMRRLFVMDAGWKAGAPTPRVFVNPQILWASDAVETAEEGCLSIPDTPIHVLRPAVIGLAWQGEDGTAHDAKLTGFDARCAQHEIDHLNGKVLFDHLSADLRRRAENAYLEGSE